MDSCLGRLNKFMLQSDSAMSPVESEADFHDDDVDAGTFLFHDDDDVDAGTNSDWPNGAGAEPGNLTEPGAACHFCTILEAIAYGYAPDSFRSLPFPVVCLWILPSAFFTSLTVAFAFTLQFTNPIMPGQAFNPENLLVARPRCLKSASSNFHSGSSKAMKE